MSFEPRMRGTRFRRTTTKKQSREKKEEHETAVFYQEEAPANPAQVSLGVLNALQHLGTQRFALPPFSEHFERWIKDVESTLTEFEAELPKVADQSYRMTVERILSDVQQDFHKRIDAEKGSSEALSKLQQELTSCELELSRLEREHRRRMNETKRGHEKSLEALRSEIDLLDRQRLKLLRRAPTILERILHRSGSKLEDSTIALQSKRTVMGTKEATLKHDLDNLREGYETSRKKLAEQQQSLKAKLSELKGNRLDDALETRTATCQELSRAVTEAIDRLPRSQTTSNAENIQ